MRKNLLDQGEIENGREHKRRQLEKYLVFGMPVIACEAVPANGAWFLDRNGNVQALVVGIDNGDER